MKIKTIPDVGRGRRWGPLIFALIWLATCTSIVAAHPGRQDSTGGHTCRTNCSKYGLSDGQYHHHVAASNSSGKYKSSSRQSTGSLSVTPRRSTTKQAKSKNKSKYDRDEWPHWIDDDSDCQNTRAEILIRDSKRPVKFKKNKGCTVTWGEWLCPYTGKTFTKASDIDIDHIVPLSHAHKSGGAGWSKSQKRAFANDPLNLLATEDNVNQSKGSRGVLKWKPPLESYWPEFAKRWRAVKEKYGLRISLEEDAVLKQMEGGN